MTNRRNFIAGSGSLLGLLAVRHAHAQGFEGGRSTESHRLPIICVEEHASDPEFARATQRQFAALAPYVRDIGSRYRDDPARGGPTKPRLTYLPQSMREATRPLADRLQAMDQAGIDFQVISLSNATQIASGPDAVDLVRATNDRLAAQIARNPNRFAAFCSLPWQDPEASLREAERCIGQLGFTGVVLSGRPHSTGFIDDPRYEPTLAALAARRAPLFIHPGPPMEQVRLPYYTGFNAEVAARFSLFGWGWHHEAGIQVLRLILAGILDRHRGLNLLSGHWGEMVPFFLQRLDDTMPVRVTGLIRSIGETYRDQVWVHPSGMLDDAHFNFIRDVIGLERIVFSIDYPYLTMTGARAWLERLPIAQGDREKIAYANASQLLNIDLAGTG